MEGRRSKPHKHWWFRPPAHSSPTWRFTAKCISLVHVSAFVAKLQRAHDDRTLDWVNDRNVSAATRAAVIAYVAKPGTITITRSRRRAVDERRLALHVQGGGEAGRVAQPGRSALVLRTAGAVLLRRPSHSE